MVVCSAIVNKDKTTELSCLIFSFCNSISSLDLSVNNFVLRSTNVAIPLLDSKVSFESISSYMLIILAVAFRKLLSISNFCIGEEVSLPISFMFSSQKNPVKTLAISGIANDGLSKC